MSWTQQVSGGADDQWLAFGLFAVNFLDQTHSHHN
jgi:hypothetical protein